MNALPASSRRAVRGRPGPWAGLLLALLLPAKLHAQPTPALAARRAELAAATTAPVRTRALLDVGLELLDNSATPDSSLAYIRRGYRQARALGDSGLVAYGGELLGEYYLAMGDLRQAGPWLHRSERQLPYLDPGKRVRVLGNLGEWHTAAGRLAVALGYQRRAFGEAAHAHPTDRDYLHGRLAHEISKAFYSQKQLDSTVRWARRAQQFFRRAGAAFQLEESYSLNQEALVLLNQGHLRQAAQSLRQVLATQQRLHDVKGPTLTLLALANVAVKQDSGTVALRYLRRAHRYVRQNGMTGSLPSLYNNMAGAYQARHQPDSAAHYYQRAIAEQRQQQGEAATLGFRLSAGRFYRTLGRWAEAAAQARVVLAQPAAPPDLRADAYALLRAEAEHRRDYATAYRLQSQETALRDTLRQHDSRRLAEDLRVRYETAQAEQQVLLLTQRGRLQTQQQELARLRYQRQLGGLAAVALLLLAGGGGGLLLYRRRQHRREAQLRTRLAADLHDEVGTLLTRVSVQAELLGSLPAAQQAPAVAGLLRNSRAAAGTMRDVVWGIDARADSAGSLFDRMREYLHQTAATAGWHTELDVAGWDDAAPLPPVLRQGVYRIFKEAVTNAVRHAQGATALRVRVGRPSGHLLLELTDDGRPQPPPATPRTGMGLRNMQQRAHDLGGHLVAEAGPTGFRVRLEIPVA